MPQYRMPSPSVLTPWTPESLGVALAGINSRTMFAASSVAWAANNLAWFYPFGLLDWATAYRLFFMVGAVPFGNIDVGIYDSQKNLIVSSGSTAMSVTVNTLQELNIADTVLPPGDYLLGVACSSTVGTAFIGTVAADELILSCIPIYEQASALPLPNPCVPVISTQNAPNVVVCGIQFRPTF